MPTEDWQKKLPYDFSNKSKEECEEAGWERIGIYDVDITSGSLRSWTFGSLDPFDKIATKLVFKNERLGLTANVYDFFDQGARYVEWNKTGAKPWSAAIKISEAKWTMMPEQNLPTISQEYRDFQGKRVVSAVKILFVNKSLGIIRIKPAVSIRIVREEY